MVRWQINYAFNSCTRNSKLRELHFWDTLYMINSAIFSDLDWPQQIPRPCHYSTLNILETVQRNAMQSIKQCNFQWPLVTC